MKTIRLLFALFVALLLAPADAGLKAVSNVAGSVSPTAFPLLAPDGSIGAPSYSWSSDSTLGFFRSGVQQIDWVVAGTNYIRFGTGLNLHQVAGISWGSNGINTPDIAVVRDAAGTIGQKVGTTAQGYRLYFSTTGPVYWQTTARTAGALFTASGGAAQVSYAQTTVPTCTTNCGTGSPTVAGTDTAGIITLGTTPASGFQVNFNGTWPAAPSCIVQSALATMVVGKMPIAVVTTTTTMTVTTNGTAPSSADKYQYHCLGVS